MCVDRAIAVAELIAVLNKVDGRKRLQKIVHLLQERGARDFQYRFVLHYFGPFSHELARDLDFLGAVGLVREEPPTGGDGTYVYSMPSPDVAERLRGIRGDDDPEPAWVPLATSLNEKETPLLEALSTVVFFSQRGRDSDALRAEFAKAKPHLEARFEEALGFGQELELL